MKKLFLVSFITLLTAIAGFSQSATTLRNRCPNTSVYSIVQITGVGDINVQPCAGKTTTFTQNVVLPSSVVIPNASITLANGSAATPSLRFSLSPTTGLYSFAGNILGISTAGAVNSTFGAAANTFRSASHIFSNVAGTAQFNTSLTPSDTVGTFTAGDCVTTPTACLSLAQSANTASLRGGSGVTINSAGTSTTIGDTGAVAGGTTFKVDDGSGFPAFWFSATANTATVLASSVQTWGWQRTITAAGTTGNQTISKPSGSVNLAAGASSIVVTNTTVATSSIVTAVANTNDATCAVKNAVPTANTITINMTAACTGETRVAFMVWN